MRDLMIKLVACKDGIVSLAAGARPSSDIGDVFSELVGERSRSRVDGNTSAPTSSAVGDRGRNRLAASSAAETLATWPTSTRVAPACRAASGGVRVAAARTRKGCMVMSPATGTPLPPPSPTA